ncbi:uracil-DNA glycosylase [Aquitalea sp.]|uniref:uracil-DNA glycosylase n=1 Tax=Aquitalea sp. TaxID=1872623 RepID=UPI002582AD86|nr:uracil-DNA glycosylase [Aquitalea sp.]
MSRSRFVQQAMGLGPQWQAREGWFDQHPAELEKQALLQTAQAQQAEMAATISSLEPEQPSTPMPAVELPRSANQPPVAVNVTTAPVSAPEAANPAILISPAVEVAIPSWDQLEQNVANCQRCQLCNTRSQTVFGRGNPQARWMLIGEAPGEQEDKQGQPFVGKAGQLLDNMLAAAGLDRDRDVYIANVLKCRPPGNRNPAPEEILACQDYLQQQIRHVQPTLILALGRFAVQTLLQTEQTIGRLRGQLHQYQGIPLIATYHPAYLLRNLPDKAKAWQDMVLAKQQFARLSQSV